MREPPLRRDCLQHAVSLQQDCPECTFPLTVEGFAALQRSARGKRSFMCNLTSRTYGNNLYFLQPQNTEDRV